MIARARGRRRAHREHSRATGPARRRRGLSTSRTARGARDGVRRRRSRGRHRRRSAGRAAACGSGGRRRSATNSANASLSGSGPSFSSGPSSPGASTHQPALRSVPCSRTSSPMVSASESSEWRGSVNRILTTEPFGRVRFGGSSMSRRPACDRCTSIRPAPPSSKTRYLPRRPTPETVAPMSDSGGGANVFSPEKPSGSNASTTVPASFSESRSDNACIWGISGTPETLPGPGSWAISPPLGRRASGRGPGLPIQSSESRSEGDSKGGPWGSRSVATSGPKR